MNLRMSRRMAGIVAAGLLAARMASASDTPPPDDENSPAVADARPGPMSRMAAPLRQWEIRLSDLRLDRALQRWAQEAGYSLRWDADRYVVIGANARYAGSLEQAIEAVLATPGIRGSAYPLEACIYSNHPPLIRITRLGDQADECK